MLFRDRSRRSNRHSRGRRLRSVATTFVTALAARRTSDGSAWSARSFSKIEGEALDPMHVLKPHPDHLLLGGAVHLFDVVGRSIACGSAVRTPEDDGGGRQRDQAGVALVLGEDGGLTIVDKEDVIRFDGIALLHARRAEGHSWHSEAAGIRRLRQ